MDFNKYKIEFKQNLKGNVCLILSYKEFHYLKNKEYIKLRLGTKGIINALSEFEDIKKITIGFIEKTVEIREKKNKLKIFINHITQAICIKIDQLESKLRGVDLSDFELLDSKSFEKFYKKIDSYIPLKQKKVGFKTFTEIKKKDDRNNEFDMFIRGSGLGIEKGNLLRENSKYGILSVHHGDNRLNRGSPVGFWEVNYKENSGITIQLLNQELDGGKVVNIARLKTQKNPTENKLNIYKHTSPSILISLKSLYKKELLDFSNKKNIFSNTYFREILRNPTFFESLKTSLGCLFRTLIKYLPKVLDKIQIIMKINPGEKWNVAITLDKRNKISKWVHLETENKNDWHADPFITKIKNKNYLLTEYFIYKKNKGVISAQEIKINKNKIELGKRMIILENNFHLSYPFTFEKNGRTYMIPENNKNGCIIYELSTNSYNNKIKCKLIRKILKGHCVDPTLITYKGIDYLFISYYENSSDQVLRCYFSKDIINAKLREHPTSPIIVDHTLGRSAGRIIEIDNKIIRPSQQNINSYGEAVHFSELFLSKQFITMTKLSDIINIPINKSDYIKTHHLENKNELTAIDYVLRKKIFKFL